MINVTIIGATGYTGMELVRLVSCHPKFKITHLVSSSSTECISDMYKNLIDKCNLNLEPLNIPLQDKDTDVYITALPHGTSMPIIKNIYNSTNKKIVDLGADFRYSDVSIYEQWYNLEHTAKEIPSVYGLCELNKEKIKSSRLIGNPGCYTTCSILALSPLVKNGLIDNKSIIIDAKSGTTGAGKKCTSNTHFCETNENMKAYSVATHRHTSEIEEQLSMLCDEKIILNFTPHLLPVNRGIIATCYANLSQKITKQQVIDLYKQFYNASPFVKVLENSLPELKYVVGSNNCYIGLEIDNRTNRIIVVSTIDNLMKGASGQAIQNLNLMFGFKENLGLDFPAWYL